MTNSTTYCPFCGSDSLTDKTLHDGHDAYDVVECESCEEQFTVEVPTHTSTLAWTKVPTGL